MSSPLKDAPSQTDARLQLLQQWLAEVLGAADFDIRPASADASFRRYFRVTRGSDSWIAMDAPPDKEDMEPYVRVASMLVAVGVNAPRVLHQNSAQGFLLNSDLGARTYLQELENGGNVEALYGDAMNALLRIQGGGDEHARTLPKYDEALLRREMSLFPEWFCARHLSMEIGAEETAGLERIFDVLVRAALEQPRVFVHRDYHSRNLMVTDGARLGPNPGILDFQDAVHGPITYDLVSLLRDCYVAWPGEQVRGWVASYYRQARSLGLTEHADEATFQRWFDLMGVQRHLKAIGIFARLWHRDGKPGYLKDIPRTLAYVSAVCAEHGELRFLGTWIGERLAPALAQVSRRS